MLVQLCQGFIKKKKKTCQVGRGVGKKVIWGYVETSISGEWGMLLKKIGFTRGHPRLLLTSFIMHGTEKIVIEN